MATMTESKPPSHIYWQERVCLHCGKKFWVYKSQLEKKGSKGYGQYCSRQCRIEAKGQERKCPVCGKTYWVYNSAIKSGHNKYCSVQCSIQGMSETKKAKYRQETQCQLCGITFSVLRSTLEKGGGQYCSNRCRNLARKYQNSEERECLNCGKRFWVNKSQLNLGFGKYCSIQCRVEAKKNRVSCICEVCGSKFERVPADVERGHAKYCSLECAAKGHGLLRQKREVKIVCPNCGKEFWVPKAYVRAHNPRFCSLPCRTEYTIKQRTRICDFCGKEFQVASLYDAERMGGRFCSRECMFKGLSPTSIELLLYGALRQARIKYIPQQYIHVGDTRTFVDSYLPVYKACIFADGTYWHSFEHIRERDKSVQKELEENGYRVFRLDEVNMKQDLVRAVNSILGSLGVGNLLTTNDIKPIERWKAKEEIARARKVSVRCKICGTLFDVPRRIARKARYCSDECRAKARELRKTTYPEIREKACETCGKLFMPKSHGSLRPSDKAKYCSKKCATEGQMKYKTCPVCGTVFHSPKGRRKYCSDNCVQIALRKLKTHHIVRQCIQCGKQISLSPSQAKKTNKLFCSKACEAEHNYDKNKEQCLNCGNYFKKTHPWNKFCSRACYDLYRAKQQVV